MDTEKYVEIQKKIRDGKSPNDEGPYYHHSWWESYKGGIKGKLGGVIGGGIVGALVGGIVATVATLVPALGMGFAGALGIMGAFAAAGSMYGAHEFGEIGRITGAVAASQKHAEARMKSFEEGKFSK